MTPTDDFWQLLDRRLAALAETIARRTAELLRAQPKDADPWLTREQAERHLNFTRTAFWRARQDHPDELAPCSEKPLRWSRNALDVFKLRRSGVRRARG